MNGTNIEGKKEADIEYFAQNIFYICNYSKTFNYKWKTKNGGERI